MLNYLNPQVAMWNVKLDIDLLYILKYFNIIFIGNGHVA